MLGVGLGGVLGELFVEFGGLRAGDDFDDIGAEGRADLDFESAFVGAGDVDGFVGWNEGGAAEAVRKEDDRGAVALMTQDGDVALLGAADAEADVFTCCVGSFAIGRKDLNLEILGDFGEAVLGDFLNIGEALLDILGLDDALHAFACRLCGVGPDFGFDLGGGDDEAGLLDLAAFEPSEFGIDSDLISGGVETSTDDAFNALDGDFLNAGAGFEDALALEFAFHLEVGEAVAGDNLEFSGLAEGDFEFIAEHGGEWGKKVGILVGEVADSDIHLLARRFFAEFGGEVLEGIGSGGSGQVRRKKYEGRKGGESQKGKGRRKK